MGYRAKKIVTMLLLAILAIFALGFAVMWLWNWLIPDLFGGKPVNFIQSLGLLLLAKIFIGFGTGFSGHNRWKNRHSRHQFGNGHSLSPEEKERLKEKFMEKCGWTSKRDSH